MTTAEMAVPADGPPEMLSFAPANDDERRHRVGLYVAALRSGDYPQICGTLATRNDEGVLSCCALGVAIEVAISNGLDIIERIDPVGSAGGMVGYRDHQYPYVSPDAAATYYAALPSAVAEWYGFENAWSGMVTVQGEAVDWWNDCQNKTFADLAQMIEDEYITAPAAEVTE